MQFSNKVYKSAVFFIAILFCAMLRPPFFSLLVTETTPYALFLRVLYDGSTILIGIALVAASRWKRRRSPTSTPPSLPFLTSVSAIGVAGINICEFLRFDSIVLYSASVLLISVGFVALTTGLFSRLSLFRRSEIAPFVLAAFTASHFLGFLDLFPRQIETWIAALYPIAASILLRFCLSKKSLEPQAVDASERNATTLAPYYKQMRAMAIALIFVEILCGTFLRSSYVQGGVGYSVSALTIFTYIVSAAIGILFYAAAKKAETATEGAIIIGGMGLVCFLIASFFLSVTPIGVLAPLITGTFSALIVFLAALIELWNLDGDATAATCAGVFTALYSSTTAITTTIAPQVISLTGLVPAESYASFGAGAGLFASIGACVLLLATTYSHRESYHIIESTSKQRSHDVIPIEREESEVCQIEEKTKPIALEKTGKANQDSEDDDLHALAVKRVADRFSLTERERQTVLLITKGFTARKVAEEMVVAMSTVQGYCKSIYKKLGIHRKDELIEVIEEEEFTIRQAHLRTRS